MMDEFTTAYIECALWSTNDESDPSGGVPLDQNYGIEDLAPECRLQMVEDCRRFQENEIDDDACLRKTEFPMAMAGHDFWLTRNGHGAGFWDGDWQEAGERLTEASKSFGEVNLYVDNGLIHYN